MRAHFWTCLVRKNNYVEAQRWASKNPKIGTSGKTTFGHVHANAHPSLFATELSLQLDLNSSPNLLPIICFRGFQSLRISIVFAWVSARLPQGFAGFVQIFNLRKVFQGFWGFSLVSCRFVERLAGFSFFPEIVKPQASKS